MTGNRWLSLHDFAQSCFHSNPQLTKEQLAKRVAGYFNLDKDRSVFYADDLAVRFSFTAQNRSFSNCIVSLRMIKKYDDRPFLVCVLRPGGVETLLANSTFVKKVSHSSHMLTLTNIRGTILGHDIQREFADLANSPKNFAELFAIHQAFTWGENFERIVEATMSIVPVGEKYQPSSDQVDCIMESIRKSEKAVTENLKREVEQNLLRILEERKTLVLEASLTDNVNIRGNLIEQILTKGSNLHSFQDVAFRLPGNLQLLVDIKSKLLDRASSPKMYNIDKMLTALSDGNTLVDFFFVGVDARQGTVVGRLVSIFDRAILGATRVQFHWAGRNSRGVTQLTGNVDSIFGLEFREVIDVAAASDFVHRLIRS